MCLASELCASGIRVVYGVFECCVGFTGSRLGLGAEFFCVVGKVCCNGVGIRSGEVTNNGVGLGNCIISSTLELAECCLCLSLSLTNKGLESLICRAEDGVETLNQCVYCSLKFST